MSSCPDSCSLERHDSAWKIAQYRWQVLCQLPLKAILHYPSAEKWGRTLCYHLTHTSEEVTISRWISPVTTSTWFFSDTKFRWLLIPNFPSPYPDGSPTIHIRKTDLRKVVWVAHVGHLSSRSTRGVGLLLSIHVETPLEKPGVYPQLLLTGFLQR